MYEFTRSSSCFSAKFLKNNLRTPYFFRSTNNRGETTFISYEYRSKRDGMEEGGEGETNGENVETRCTPNQANSILLERLEGREPSKRVTSGNKGCTHFSWGTFFGNRWPDYSSHELKKNHVYQITEIRVLDTNRSIRLSVWQRSFPRWTIIDFEGIFIRKRGRNTIVSITYQMDACSI